MTSWPFQPPLVPMEAEVADELPRPPGWAYEPKWDGFRVLVWSPSWPASASEEAECGCRLDSRNAKPLLRYFPELKSSVEALPPGTVLDGEVVILTGDRLDFDALQNRIHPAAGRVAKLSADTPAGIALFDVLALRGTDLRGRPFSERRAVLVDLAAELPVGAAAPGAAAPMSPWLLSPSTTDVDVAGRWFHDFEAAGFDGIVAKRLDHPYAEGRRDMVKVKHRRTVDCVVGGFRVRKDGEGVASLLLGLYDAQGELHFIGHCSSFDEAQSATLLQALRDMAPSGGEGAGGGAGPDGESAEAAQPAGFGPHARRPGSPSRWSHDRDPDYVAVLPVLVVEVSYDQLTADRFRHATRFERWRPDKDPQDCTMGQLERPRGDGVVSLLRRVGSQA